MTEKERETITDLSKCAISAKSMPTSKRSRRSAKHGARRRRRLRRSGTRRSRRSMDSVLSTDTRRRLEISASNLRPCSGVAESIRSKACSRRGSCRRRSSLTAQRTRRSQNHHRVTIGRKYNTITRYVILNISCLAQVRDGLLMATSLASLQTDDI